MKNYIIIASSIFLTTTTTNTFAADAIIADEAPLIIQQSTSKPATSTFKWDGTYFGGQLDYRMGKVKFSQGSNHGTGKGNGFMGGLYGGYNMDIGNNFILGAEADVSSVISSKKKDNAGKADSFATTGLGLNGAVRARLGYSADRFMPYIAGGLAIGEIKNKLQTKNESFSNSKVKKGWTVGAGVDYAATDNVILRAEYRYTDFGKQNLDFGGDNKFSSKASANDIRIGIAYKF